MDEIRWDCIANSDLQRIPLRKSQPVREVEKLAFQNKRVRQLVKDGTFVLHMTVPADRGLQARSRTPVFLFSVFSQIIDPVGK